MLIPFFKYEGAGNDFLLIDNREGVFTPDKALIARLCDRHFGIGGDGLMTLSLDEQGVVQMHYYNADGSEGEMCGNGARCFALFAHHLGVGGAEQRFVALDGEHTASLRPTSPDEAEVEVAICPVSEIYAGEEWFSLNTGVPHYVEFVEAVEAVDCQRRGAEIRYDTARFPQGTNVNFATPTGEGTITMRTYERGVERETLACGTGATAVAIVTNYALQPACNCFAVQVPGGVLTVRFDHSPNTPHYTNIRLQGPARRVFAGAFDTQNF